MTVVNILEYKPSRGGPGKTDESHWTLSMSLREPVAQVRVPPEALLGAPWGPKIPTRRQRMTST